MTEADVLLADPVFQLNVILWAVEDVADAGRVDPVLRKAGYYLDSIGRSLQVPVNPRALDALRLVAGPVDRSPTRPDVWLRHQEDETWPVIELKASGFSEASSNRVQALKMLVSASDLAPSLGGGGPRPGFVLYATVSDDAGALEETIQRLRTALIEVGAAPAPAATIGFQRVAEGVALRSPPMAAVPAAMRSALGAPAVVLRADGPDDDLHPLYFIPWLPGIDDSQDPVLRADGLREITARLLTQAIAALGRARTPTILALDGADLLDHATFGIFSRWRDADRKQFALAATGLLEKALLPTGRVHRQRSRLDVDLADDEARDVAIDRLEKADPMDPSKSLSTALEAPPTLFDESLDGQEPPTSVLPPSTAPS